MTDLEKILITAAASGLSGYLVGIAHMLVKHKREDRIRQEEDLRTFGEAFLAQCEQDKNLHYSAEKRLGALQKLGAYRFNRRELESFRAAIIARGLPDPYVGHSNILGHLPDYPFCVFQWANQHHVDLGDEIAVLEALIASLEKSAAPLSKEQDQQLFRWQLALEVARGNR
ncbi:MAG: hypothetical protein NVV63_18415 [Opitutus sp.]|nr:hypothetical protein [Opitutus sp.]